MLDAFGTDNPGDYIGGFPDHPHRGFETVTYMLDGRMRHRDSAGNDGLLSGGGVQWMTAGRGIIHCEMPEQEDGRMEGFQLWLNLPARDKMCPPWYRDIPAAEIPRAADGRRRERARHRRRQPRRGRRDAARAHRAARTWTCSCRRAPASSRRCRPRTTPSSTSIAARSTIGGQAVPRQRMAILANTPGSDGVRLRAGERGRTRDPDRRAAAERADRPVRSVRDEHATSRSSRRCRTSRPGVWPERRLKSPSRPSRMRRGP